MRASSRRTRAGAGFTLVEAALALTAFVALLAGFLFSVERMSNAYGEGEVSHALAIEAFDAARSITQEISRAGFRDQHGERMPVLFADGDPGVDHPAFAHEPPGSGEAVREILYRLPRDGDGDGWPDVDANGEAVWESAWHGLLCLPLEDGTDALVRRAEDGTTVVLARNVARLVFETPAETGFAIPLDSLRFTLTLRRADADGRACEFEVQRVVRLRNGGLAP